MAIEIIEDKDFENIDFTDQSLKNLEYVDCKFFNCIFNGSDLSNTKFSDCVLDNCDLSLANLSYTAFQYVEFKGCKLVGVHFENCNSFLWSVDFLFCDLNLASFYQMQLKKTKFNECNLQEVDFTEADAQGINFATCNLTGAIFENTVLEKCDFRTATGFTIDPDTNHIRKAKFTVLGATGLLYKYGIEIE